MKDIYVITGATGGMGEDIALNINPKGINILVDLDDKKLKKLSDELKKKKIESITFKCDITDQSRINELVELVKETGHFKALIHTAGISGHMGTANRILDVNLAGTALLTNAFYEIADNSIIILISSMSGRLVPDSFLYDKALSNPLDPNLYRKIKLFAGKPDNAYAFSKKGVHMLVEREVGKWAFKNSRIISVSPGAIETDLALLEAENNPAVNIMIKHSPISRFGTVQEVTAMVKYLCSDDANFITGADFLIDGGATSHMKYNNIFKDLK